MEQTKFQKKCKTAVWRTSLRKWKNKSQTWENICNTQTWPKTCFQHINNSFIKEKRKAWWNMDKNLTKEDIWTVRKHRKRCSSSVIIREIQSKIRIRYTGYITTYPVHQLEPQRLPSIYGYKDKPELSSVSDRSMKC